MTLLTTLIGTLLFAVAGPVIGCLLAGLDRIISARMQGRVGPPLLQPYYDVRKLFEKEENRKIERMNVLADDGGAGFGFQAYYTRIPLTTRYWDKRMYLFPIVQAEIDKGVGLVQNPGW